MICLQDLEEGAAYAVLLEPGVDTVVRGETLRRRWHGRNFLKMPPDHPLPPNYVRVECDEPGQSVAVWRDPSRPELAEPQLGEELPAPIRAATEAAQVRPAAVELVNRVAEAIESDSFAAPEETLDDALLRAGERLAETLGLAS